MKQQKLAIFLVLFLASISASHSFVKDKGKSYKPVVIIHGIFDHRDSLYSLADRITEKHPGTSVTIIDKLHGWKSISPLWYQVKTFKKIFMPIMEANPGGVHLIGFSQGGLVARGLIETTENHNVHNFISLSSPQAGQYGDDFLHIFFPGYVKESVWRFFYSKEGQFLSIGNYWRDPHHTNLFLNYSSYLTKINNIVDNDNATQFKDTFTKLKNLVLIGGPDDGIISPWQSSHFGFYNEDEVVVNMKDRDIYKKDTFGLRTLDESGRLVRYTIPGVQHLQWHRNISVIDSCILPYLD